jgi:hypothetical protein
LRHYPSNPPRLLTCAPVAGNADFNTLLVGYGLPALRAVVSAGSSDPQPCSTTSNKGETGSVGSASKPICRCV